MNNHIHSNKKTTLDPDRLSYNPAEVKSTYCTPTKRAIDIFLLTGGGSKTKANDGGGGENSYTGTGS